MSQKVQAFRQHVIELSNGSPTFPHQEWFVTYHLEIVERIAHELCDVHPEADRDLVTLLVWLHDYGKIVDFDDQYAVTLTAGKKKLLEMGFSVEEVEKVVSYVDCMDKKVNLESPDTPIEIKIVSSADGAAHLVGPFFPLYWHDHPETPFEELMRGNTEKAKKDWDKKVVLPEVKRAFQARHDFFLEMVGKMPEKFLQ